MFKIIVKMQRAIALSWILPAAMILLLHTLIPHSHDFISQNNQHNCHHQQHHVWEFVEHLLEQSSGENHLESYQVETENDFDVDNSSLFVVTFSSFSTKRITSFRTVIFPKNDDILRNTFFSNSLSYRGPPLA